MTGCHWVYNGINWVADPNNGHSCPQGMTCAVPMGAGYIGEQRSTNCVVPE